MKLNLLSADAVKKFCNDDGAYKLSVFCTPDGKEYLDVSRSETIGADAKLEDLGKVILFLKNHSSEIAASIDAGMGEKLIINLNKRIDAYNATHSTGKIEKLSTTIFAPQISVLPSVSQEIISQIKEKINSKIMDGSLSFICNFTNIPVYSYDKYYQALEDAALRRQITEEYQQKGYDVTPFVKTKDQGDDCWSIEIKVRINDSSMSQAFAQTFAVFRMQIAGAGHLDSYTHTEILPQEYTFLNAHWDQSLRFLRQNNPFSKEFDINVEQHQEKYGRNDTFQITLSRKKPINKNIKNQANDLIRNQVLMRTEKAIKEAKEKKENVVVFFSDIQGINEGNAPTDELITMMTKEHVRLKFLYNGSVLSGLEVQP